MSDRQARTRWSLAFTLAKLLAIGLAAGIAVLVLLRSTTTQVDVNWLRVGLFVVSSIALLSAIRTGHRVALVSPPLWLGLWIAGPFVLVPAAFLAVYTPDLRPDGILSAVDVEHILTWQSSGAEHLLIGFSATMLGLAIAVAMRSPIFDVSFATNQGGVAVVLFLAALALVVIRIFLVRADIGSIPLMRDIADAAIPAVSLSAAFSVAAYSSKGKWCGILVLANGLLLAAAAILLMNGKLPIMIFIAAAVFYSSLRAIDMRSVAIGIVVLLVLGAISTIVLANLRQYPGWADHIERTTGSTDGAFVSHLSRLQFSGPLIQKLWVRQVTTGACLQDVIDRRLHSPALQSPWYFLSSVVPRYLWTDKPSLSRGSIYAVEFCGLQESDISPTSPHSAAITLIGEPVAEAGAAGLAVAIVFLLGLLGCLGWLMHAGSMAVRIIIVTLLPWTTDFEQSLSFYVANATKSLLYVLLIILLARVAVRFMPVVCRAATRSEA